MSKALEQAIENLYKAFRRYPVNLHMDGSPLYHELEQWNKSITSKNLRSLSDNDLRIFHFKVMTTWGDVNDFKHYLPRIFELLTKIPNEFEEWVALDKLNYGRWREWPLNEQQAIDNYLLLFWGNLVGRSPLEGADVLETYLDAIANVYPNFNDLLKLWELDNSENSIRNLTNYFFYNSEYLLYGKVLPGFSMSKERGKIFYEWLTDEKTLKILKEGFYEYPNKDFSESLSIVVQMIESRKL